MSMIAEVSGGDGYRCQADVFGRIDIHDHAGSSWQTGIGGVLSSAIDEIGTIAQEGAGLGKAACGKRHHGIIEGLQAAHHSQ